MTKRGNLLFVIIISLWTAYKAIFLGLILWSKIASSFEIGSIGTKSITQILLDVAYAGIFLVAFFHFMRSKHRVMMVISLLGLVCHIALVLWTANVF